MGGDINDSSVSVPGASINFFVNNFSNIEEKLVRRTNPPMIRISPKNERMVTCVRAEQHAILSHKSQLAQSHMK